MAMLNRRNVKLIGGAILISVLGFAAGCASNAGPATTTEGSATADSGFIQQTTTGGDAANTFNIRNKVGGEAPAILMTPPGGSTQSQPAAQSTPTNTSQATAPTASSKPARKATPAKPAVTKPSVLKPNSGKAPVGTKV